jgi:helix-turn-helix protein
MFYVDIDENEFRQIIQTLVDMEYAKLEIGEKKRKILKKIKHNGG